MDKQLHGGEAKRQGLGVWSAGPSGITRPWDQTSKAKQSTARRFSWAPMQTLAWHRAQKLLAQGHSYLDGDGDGDACESLRQQGRVLPTWQKQEGWAPEAD